MERRKKVKITSEPIPPLKKEITLYQAIWIIFKEVFLYHSDLWIGMLIFVNTINSYNIAMKQIEPLFIQQTILNILLGFFCLWFANWIGFFRILKDIARGKIDE